MFVYTSQPDYYLTRMCKYLQYLTSTFSFRSLICLTAGRRRLSGGWPEKRAKAEGMSRLRENKLNCILQRHKHFGFGPLKYCLRFSCNNNTLTCSCLTDTKHLRTDLNRIVVGEDWYRTAYTVSAEKMWLYSTWQCNKISIEIDLPNLKLDVSDFLTSTWFHPPRVNVSGRLSSSWSTSSQTLRCLSMAGTIKCLPGSRFIH